MGVANISGNILTDSGTNLSSLVSGSGTTNYVSKWTASGVLGNSLIFDNGTNIGIGTNTPYEIAPSNVNIDIRSATYSFLQVGTSSTATASDVGYLEFMNGNNKRLGTIAGGADGTALAGYMRFSTANSSGNFTERMRITSNGLVGINTNTPNVLLEVKGGSAMTTLANSYTNAGFIHQYNSTNILALGSNGSSMIIQGVNAGTNGAVPLLLQPFDGSVGIGSTTVYNGGGFGRVLSIYETSTVAISLVTSAKQYQVGIAGTNNDFRIYDFTGTTYRFAINGSTGNIGIGLTNPQYSLSLPQDSKIGWNDTGNTKRGSITVNSSGDAMVFTTGTSDAERMRIISTGEVLLHSTSFNSTLVGQLFGTGGDTYFTTDTGQILYLNRKGNDGTLVDFRRDNSVKGTISVSGETVSYNSFLGSHWSQLQDGSKIEILKGTIIEVIDEMCQWQDEINDRLPKSKISDTIESKNVYGTFLAWDEDWETSNDFYVAAVGLGYIRVNSNEVVSIGDLLQSNGDGTAKVQSDDIIRSSTIAKVVSTQKIETYEDGSYLIAATLHCG